MEPQLLAGERLVSVEHIEIPPRRGAPSVVRALRSFVSRGGGPVFAAALPDEVLDTDASPALRLFEALFSRDALIVADTLDAWWPDLTHRTVLCLAGLQGLEHKAEREEEPGRIPHEIRAPDDPVAVKLSMSEG